MPMTPVAYGTEPTTPPTLKEYVFSLLLDAIMSGRIKPGERLIETRLAAQFQVSRAPIREALNRLLEQGLAISRPRRGLFVVELQKEDTQKINSLRLVLEAEALRLCKSRLTPEHENKLIQLIDKMEHVGPQPGIDAMRMDLEFHRTIWRMSGNEYLERALVGLTSPLFGKWVLMMQEEERHRKVLPTHRAMVDFVQGTLNQSAEDVMLQILSVRWVEPARFSSFSKR